MEGLPSGYRPNVGVCLINDDNLVFVASRLNVPGAWQMPQGGVEDDEDPKLAAVRALREETGVVSAEIIAEVPKWLTYDFPPTVRTKVNRLWGGGQWHGQAQKWYLMRLTKDNSEVNLANGETDTEFSEWKWATPDEVIEQAADYKRPTYEEVVRTFRPYLEPTGISESEMETSTTRPLEFPSQNPKTLILEEEEERHIRIAGLLKDAIFNNLSGKYVNEYHSTINAEHLKSQIERHLLEQLPFFRTPSHPPYASMIQRAIVELGEEGGSSEKTISEFIKREYEDLPWAHTVLVKRHLGKLCESGELEGSKCGLYMFPVEDKKLLRKKKKKRRGKGRDCLQRVVKDRDEIDDVKRRKQSLKLGTKGEVDKGIEEKSTDSCTEQSKGIEEDDRAQGCLVGVVEEASERKDGGVVKIEEKSGEERRAMEEQTEVKTAEEDEIIAYHSCPEEILPSEEEVDEQNKLQEKLHEVSDQNKQQQEEQPTPRRGRGRPPKAKTGDETESEVGKSSGSHNNQEGKSPLKLGQGRPSKSRTDEEPYSKVLRQLPLDSPSKIRGRGRPPKPKSEDVQTSSSIQLYIEEPPNIIPDSAAPPPRPISKTYEGMARGVLLPSNNHHHNEKQRLKLPCIRGRGRGRGSGRGRLPMVRETIDCTVSR